MRTRLSLLLALALAAAPAAAQQSREPTTYDRAIAAGYKALTLCSGIFNAHRTQAQIEALELTGIYPEYDAMMPSLSARIDKLDSRILVTFDDGMPPRIAANRMDGGCYLYPIGVPANITLIREFIGPGSGPEIRGRWPMGDGGATGPARGEARLLAGTAAKAFDGASFGSGSRTTALVVVKDGKIVAERYASGFDMETSQRTWSVAKSLAGTIIGAAVQKGLVDPAAPAPVPEWQRPLGDPRAAITLDQLMRMASGLHSATAGNRTDAVYFGGTAVTEETVQWPLEAPPGSRFRYSNNDILLATHALRAKLGDRERDQFPDSLLFRQIGMDHTIAETDWKGNYILSSQVWSTARDLARFGMLYLNDGMWEGRRILPEGWRDYVTRPSGPQPEGEFGYGATFWLMNRSPGVPGDTFAAFGNRGQYVVIVPSRNVVIVRRGEDPAGARFDVAKLTAEILAALRP